MLVKLSRTVASSHEKQQKRVHRVSTGAAGKGAGGGELLTSLPLPTITGATGGGEAFTGGGGICKALGCTGFTAAAGDGGGAGGKPGGDGAAALALAKATWMFADGGGAAFAFLPAAILQIYEALPHFSQDDSRAWSFERHCRLVESIQAAPSQAAHRG